MSGADDSDPIVTIEGEGEPPAPPRSFQVTSPLPNSDEDETSSGSSSDFSSAAILESSTDSEAEGERVGEGEDARLQAPSSDAHRERQVGHWPTDEDGSSSFASTESGDARNRMPQGKLPPDIAEVYKCSLLTFAVLTFLGLAFVVFVAVIAVLQAAVSGTVVVGLALVASAAVLSGTALCCVYRMPYTSVHKVFSSCCNGRRKRGSGQRPNS